MYEQRSPSPGTALVLGRWGTVATTPPGEQQLLERLQAAAAEVGCRAPDAVTSVYIGLKIRMRVCVFGAARAAIRNLLDTLATAVVGADSEQVLRLRGPIGDDEVTRRFAAVRLNEFVAGALDPAAQSQAWFVVIDSPGDCSPLLSWFERELRTALRTAGVTAAPNLFVLLAAEAAPRRVERGWLCVPLRRIAQLPARRMAAVPPVGIQRRLLESRLSGPVYRDRLRRWTRRQVRRWPAGNLGRRWLAASSDALGRGLWRSNRAANDRRALLALRRCAWAPVDRPGQVY